MMYSVSSLVKYLKQEIDFNPNLQNIVLKGEVSNITYHRSGHVYFTIKDSGAQMNCVMFATYAKKTNVVMKEGMGVILSASLSMYETRGSLQLYVTKVQIDGLGDLYQRYEELKKKLSEEGLFEKSHKKQIPEYPEKIGILSAKTGAAIQDMLTTIARRWPLANVTVYPTLVQGESAAQDIIHNLLLADTKEHDIILLGRGGGSIEDLWCFNDENLARTIYNLNTVIVSGVGHETDTTLVDYVSDARAPTPTAAAELITPNKEDVYLQILDIKRHLSKIMESSLQQKRLQLEQFQKHPYMKDPVRYIQENKLNLEMYKQQLEKITYVGQTKRDSLNQILQKLNSDSQTKINKAYTNVSEQKLLIQKALNRYQEMNFNGFHKTVELLDAYSPLKILNRGYQVMSIHNHVVKSIDEVNIGDSLRIRMKDGFIGAKATTKEEVK